MTVTNAQLDAFHKFGSDQIARENAELTWDELFVRWESHINQDTIDVAVRHGIADVDAGRSQPIDEALKDLRSEFGIEE